MKFSKIIYLDKELIIEIHKLQIEEHGGLDGIRNLGGLESAIAQPEATFGGEDLYQTIFDKASAYAFHLAESQSFIDGNKRVALASALTFLAINGYEITEDQPDFYDAMIAISKHELDKKGLSDLFFNSWKKINLLK